MFQSSVRSIAESVRQNASTSSNILRQRLQRIQETEPQQHAFTQVMLSEDTISSETRRLSEHDNLALAGVPVAVKDNFCVQGWPTTASSQMLRSFVPSYTATVVRRLQNQGAVIVGKTNMDEFGMGNTTSTSSVFPATVWNEKSPGGSSGGSAVAVANGSCVVAVGSDTGGSVRQPAAICGVVGFKPSYGAFSRYGLIAYASSLDCPGLFGRTVDDVSLVSDYLFGVDPMDSTTLDVVDSANVDADSCDLKGLRVGIPQQFLISELSVNVRAIWERTAKRLEEHGAQLVDIQLPSVPMSLHAYYVIATAEASSNLSRYSGIFFGHHDHDLVRTRTTGFGSEVRRRILSGTYVLSKDAYTKYFEPALKMRQVISSDFDNALLHCDFLLCPVIPKLSMPSTYENATEGYAEDVFTVPASLSGNPAISVPVFADKVGMQLVGRKLHDRRLLRHAASVERLCAK
ncbi:mitochondrial glutamyl-tRNA (Gln) amidotransferase [Andalucia godoyi]|uniref:Glutamyl-tRNA(Gln) amidotransferase subunit A, mitochondrial n=1 Tax=Andalucia godoyi TaxID=505711 RepID=A0A8K0F315_ANDGO|nr:mitochondrial glutamyl-tRNA (Gln) amidotransferase [Andalucia godoyi]|eukprot:ANDGO_01971.mRNA.1 mitochondrial glutamyl-tRNA (Gln) amidotransferase